MPIGRGPVGFGVFLLVEFAGYAGAAQMLSKSYELPTNSWKVGGVRTVIGVAAGLMYFGLWSLSKSEPSPFLWFGGLFPIRVVEWGILLRIFFDKKLFQSARSWRYSVFGTLWSFALDAIGVGAALVVPGGMWVC
jgi:hypothetical protein